MLLWFGGFFDQIWDQFSWLQVSELFKMETDSDTLRGDPGEKELCA